MFGQFDARQDDGAGSAVDRVASAEFEFGVGPERLTPLVHPTNRARWTEQLALARPREEVREAVGTTAIGRKRE